MEMVMRSRGVTPLSSRFFGVWGVGDKEPLLARDTKEAMALKDFSFGGPESDGNFQKRI